VKTAITKPAVFASDIPVRKGKSGYPEPFFSRMAGREKRPLLARFGLTNLGVNMTRLDPGGESSIMHKHTHQDEFVFILEGPPTLNTDEGEQILAPGMCIGFPAKGVAHHLVNRSQSPVVYLEISNIDPLDEGHYPNDDLLAVKEDGTFVFKHKNGQPY